MDKKRLIIFLFAATVLGGIMGSLATLRFAGVSFPNGTFTASPSGTSSGPYAANNAYEGAVISAVQHARPSVVSIVISKNLPIIEQCNTSPLGTLPPDLQQLFGDSLQFSVPVPCQQGTSLQEVGGGSGFIVSADGLIVTNKHVVLDTKAEYTVLLNDGKKYPAKVLARDPAKDVAVLKIDATNLPVAAIGASAGLQLGQTTIAIGNALGEFRNTVSVGVVSGLSRNVTAGGIAGFSETISNVIQTDAAINEGNSGGPLLNLKGEVIGINTAIVSGANSIGFAIPIDSVVKSINSVKATGAIHTPFLGVRFVMVTTDLKAKKKLAYDYGALVAGDAGGAAVVKGSPADKAGLKSGDVILNVNGERLDENTTLDAVIQKYNVGDTVSLSVARGTSTTPMSVKLEERPTNL